MSHLNVLAWFFLYVLIFFNTVSCTNSKLDLETVLASSGYVPYLENPPDASTQQNSFSFQVKGSYVSYYKYKIGFKEQIDCQSESDYSSLYDVNSPIEYNTSSFSDGEFRLCIWAADANKLLTSISSNAEYDWTKDTVPGSVLIWGQPIGIASTSPLNIQITSLDAVEYRYAIVATTQPPRTACNTATYSQYRSVLQNINDNISALTDGPIVVCVISKDQAGNEQLASNANFVHWIKDSVNTEVFIGTLSENNNNSLPQYRVTEGETTSLSIPITIRETKNYSFNVEYTLTGDAANGTDYNLSSGSISFAANDSSKNITIPILDNSSASTGDRRLRLILTGTTSSYVKIAASHFALIDIQDNEKQNGLTVKTVAAGAHAACVILSNNKIKCWGENSYGQLALGSASKSPAADVNLPPSSFADSSYNYVSLVAGTRFLCGIVSSPEADAGKVRCWGFNHYGQLGRNTFNSDSSVVSSSEATPNFISSDLKFKQLAAGDDFICGITTNDLAYCWGRNHFGQLGNNNTTNSAVPVAVSSSQEFVQVAAGDVHACGILKSNQKVVCWGRAELGQMGDADNNSCAAATVDSISTKLCLTPQNIASNDTFNWLHAGDNRTCGITHEKKLYCWGYNQFGELGDGTTTTSNRPKWIDKNTTYDKVYLGDQQTCGITTNSKLKCWGYGYSGILGNDKTDSVSSPLDIDIQTSYKFINASRFNTCGITSNNLLKCWGSNANGQIGIGTSNKSISPSIVYRDYSFLQIDASLSERCTGSDNCLDPHPYPQAHMCALRNDKKLLCWGSNKYGQIGDGTLYDRTAGVISASQFLFKKISVGGRHTCGIIDSSGSDNNRIACWGHNNFGQLGINNSSISQSTSPLMIDDSSEYSSISTGLEHTCGLTTNNKIKCWGRNNEGQLGIGSTMDTLTPTLVDSTTDYLNIFSGGYHSCAIMDDDNKVKCWGRNAEGQLGLNNTTQARSPTALSDSQEYISLDLGLKHSCGIRSNNRVYCWGRNTEYQLGIDSNSGLTNTITSRTSPVSIKNPSNADITSTFSRISAGAEHTCALASADGRFWCWGSQQNGAGNLGYSVNLGFLDAATASPGDISTLFSEIAAGSDMTCGIEKNLKQLYCWGYSSHGAFSQGENTYKPQVVRRLQEAN